MRKEIEMSQKLRERADEMIRKSSEDLAATSPEEIRSLVMELSRRQAELESRNDALRDALKKAESDDGQSRRRYRIPADSPSDALSVHDAQKRFPDISDRGRGIADREQEKNQLRRREARFRLLAENMPVLINAVTRDARVVFWNRKCEAVTGYAREEILDDPSAMARLYPDPEYREALHREWQASDYGYRDKEVVLTARDGSFRNVAWSNLPPELSYGPGVSWAVGIDITELRRSEAALRESRENLATTLRSIGDGVIATDAEGVIVYMNPVAEALTGWTETEVRGRPLSEVFVICNSRTGEPAENPVDRVLREGKVVGMANHTALTARDGAQRQIADSAAPMRRKDGTLAGVVLVFRDVTEEYRRREELRFQAMILNQIRDLVAATDLEGRITYVNDAECRLLGRPRAALIGRSIKAFGEDPGQGVAQEEIMETVRREGSWRGDVVNFDADGNPLILDARVQTMFDEDGRPMGFCGISTDISERKRIEEALKQKTLELDAFFSSSLDLLAIADTDGRFRRLNPEWERAMGYRLEEMEGTSFFDFIHPDDAAPTMNAMATLTEQNPILNFTNRYRHKNGGYRWIEWRSFPIGNTIYACARDITDRIRAEEEIRLNQARLQSLFDISQYETDSTQDLLDYALDQAIRLTRSKAGYIYHYDEEKRRFTLNSWSRDVMKECRVDNPSQIYLVDQTGIWGEAVRQRRPIVVNDFQAPNPLKKGYPDGHVALYKYMTIPVLIDNRITAVVGVGNKESDYDDADVLQLTLLMDAVWKVTERKQADEERRRLAEAVHQTSEAVVITDPDGAIEYVNPSFERVTGYARREAVGENPRILKSGRQDAAFYQDLWSTISAGKKWSGRMINKRKDGALFTEECSITPVKDEKGKIERFVAVKKDITRELKLEEQFRQSQRLESVGRLAAGVAHDLNNLLAPILGYADLLLEDLAASEEPRRKVEQILRAAEGARDLVRQLLAFGRKQLLEVRVLDLRQIVRDIKKLLRRTLRENIALETFLSPASCAVEADAGQLGQVLMNLTVNAQDAMPDGGALTIEVTRTHLDETYCETHTGARPGHYVMLAISDTGSGMDPETQQHIFEPFFTTKADMGTGLGLATVYGIVKQHGGNIWLYSEPGKGTTFKVYLPAVGEPAMSVEALQTHPEKTGGVETVLVAEDNEMVRDLACRVLERQGYAVIAASTGREALGRLKDRRGPVHLLLTDVVMPDMDGMALSEKVAAVYPEVKVLFMSGYTENVIAHHGVLGEGIHFIQKPFSVNDLARKIRQTLDG